MPAAVKDELGKLADKLPEGATWDDVMYEIYVRMEIQEGLRAAEAGRVISHEEVKKRFAVE